MRKKIPLLVLVFLLFVGIVFRLRNISQLPIDAHPMRQTDTESVAYFFAYKDANILHPQASLIRPVTNSKGYFFLEFPLYQYVLSYIYRIFGWTLIGVRLFNLLLFIVSIFFLYRFTKEMHSREVAFWAVVFFIFMPGSLFFVGHAIHPDVFAIFLFLFSLYVLTGWLKKNTDKRILVLSIILLSLSIATRPFIALLIPGILLLLFIYKAPAIGFLGFASSPLLYGLWRVWQLRYPEASGSWENWVLGGRELLYQMPVLRNLIMKNIVGEVMGKTTVLIGLVGVISLFVRRITKEWYIVVWLFTMPLYWYLVPNGNIAHQYYANIYMVPVCLLAAVGMVWMTKHLKSIPYGKMTALIVSVGVIVLTTYNGYRTSSYFYLPRVSEEHIRIAKDIEKCIPQGKKIVYLAIDNSIPFSLVHRQGWMLGFWPYDVESSLLKILQMKQYGAEYIVRAKNNTTISTELFDQINKDRKKTCSTEAIDVISY